MSRRCILVFRPLNYLSLVISFVLILSSFAVAQKVRLRSHINPNCEVTTGLTSLKYADLHADGNVAVQGSYNCRGVFIYDLTNPDAPVLASVYNPNPQQAFLEAIVIGNRGYFGSGGIFPATAPTTGDGVHIVDLSNPYNPVLLGKVNATLGEGFNGIHEMNVYGNYLIENYNHTSVKTIKIIDVSNPSQPFLRWDFNPQDALWVHAIHIRGSKMYMSGWAGLIEIYDISNLANEPPRLLGSIQGNTRNHSSWTSEDGNYLYSARETFDGDIRVYDVRDPAQALLVRSIKTSDLGLNAVSPHNPVVMGNYLYVSWYQAGVQVFDITDPTFPRRIGQYDTFQNTFPPPDEGKLRNLADLEPWDMICGAPNIQNSLPVDYEGNWAVFPFLGQNKILAGDLTYGLYVLDATRVALRLKNRVSDFDGDGKTDFSIFRPTNGDWQIETSSNSAAGFTNFGVPNDIHVPGDYDGDGKTELAVYRPSNGVWYLQRDPTFVAVQFGVNGDVPVPGDYDADGKTDVAVWRPSTGIWFVLRSTLGFTAGQWGIPTDKPVVGDFDGDGKADFAVWRPGNGVWYIFQSSSSIPAYWQFGTDGDKPVSADFDGNGITDMAVYRPSAGTWLIFDPTAVPSQRSFFWGLSGDVPIPADYDGDGKADPTIFRPESNQWYRLNGSDGSYDVRVFGQSGDLPSPAAANPN
jgi:hypothetical protein